MTQQQLDFSFSKVISVHKQELPKAFYSFCVTMGAKCFSVKNTEEIDAEQSPSDPHVVPPDPYYQIPQIHGHWQQLSSFHFEYHTEPIFINDHEFVVFPHKQAVQDGDGIYKFNCEYNKWTKLIDYPTDDNFQVYAQTATLDKCNNCIYVSLAANDIYKYNLLRFDLDTLEIEILPECKSNGDNTRLICTESELHQIAGGYELEHFAWNTTKLGLDIVNERMSYPINECIQRNNLHNPGLIYLKSKRFIMLFGGSNDNNPQLSIYQFSTLNREWSELSTKMPFELSDMGIVTTKSEHYVILFGGSAAGAIYIYDTHQNTVMRSVEMVPCASFRHACLATITMTNEYDPKLVFGFIRDWYQRNSLSEIQIFPDSLMELVSLFYEIECVYLMGKFNGDLWRISMNHILQSNTIG